MALTVPLTLTGLSLAILYTFTVDRFILQIGGWWWWNEGNIQNHVKTDRKLSRVNCPGEYVWEECLNPTVKEQVDDVTVVVKVWAAQDK